MKRLHLSALLLVATLVSAASATAAETYELRVQNRSEIELAEIEPPDISRYRRAEVLARLQRRSGAPHIRLASMLDRTEMLEFTSEARTPEHVRRQQGHPEAIYIESGVARLSDLSAAQPDWVIAEPDGTFLARRPIVVAHAGTLVIRDHETLRLSEEDGAFLVNDGHLYVVDGTVRGWRTATNAPAAFIEASSFRPFITAWAGSQTYLVDARLADLGYQESRSYGFSIVQDTQALARSGDRAAPFSWMISTRVTGLYFGFYSYEAADIVIVDCLFDDNIVYGIDPHDRTVGLIIAGNEVRNSRKLHGIIFSRDVERGWIVDNHVHGNAGSGIVMDRASIHNHIIDNRVHHNSGEGIAFYESGDNVAADNDVHDNGRNGLYVRNSPRIRSLRDRLIGNGQHGATAFTRTLEADSRDLALDPYDESVSLWLIDPLLLGNNAGTLHAENFDSILLSGITQPVLRDSKSSLDGDLAAWQSTIFRALFQRETSVILERPGSR